MPTPAPVYPQLALRHPAATIRRVVTTTPELHYNGGGIGRQLADCSLYAELAQFFRRFGWAVAN